MIKIMAEQKINLSKSVVPIFIISFNKLTVLKEAIRSYQEYIGTPFEIVIHDTGTSFPETLQYLKKLERKGTKVYRFKHKVFEHKQDMYALVNQSINSYFLETQNKSKFYCVTDPDMAFYEKTPKDVFEFYGSILSMFRESELYKVGPMPKMDDIPDHYPLKKLIFRKYRGKRINEFSEYIGLGNLTIKYRRADVTPFGMYRRSSVFFKKRLSFRIGEPYDAKHLDWYLDYKHLTEDQKYYMSLEYCNPDISHWSGEYLRGNITKRK